MISHSSCFKSARLRWACRIALLFLASAPLYGKQKEAVDYGSGLTVNIPLPEAEVVQVVSEVAQNGIIRGSKEYNKDEYITGAQAATSSNAFRAWTDAGKVFYKVRKQALDPRNFKGSNDIGTLTVRYIVQPEGEKNTVLRIDAIFVEDFRHTAHLSNGSVESEEYTNIQDHLNAIELMKKQNAEAEVERQARLAKKNFDSDTGSGTSSSVQEPASPVAVSVAELTTPEASPTVGPRAGESLEEYAAELRRQVQRKVKIPGAPLKSAPYQSANTMQSLLPGTEVLIVISTPYWFGVETRDGQHGWLTREEVEELK